MTGTEAIQLLSIGDTAGAKALCQRAVSADPKDAEAFHLLGAALHREGRLDESAEALASESGKESSLIMWLPKNPKKILK